MGRVAQNQLIGTILILVGLVILLTIGAPLLFKLMMIVLGLYLVDRGLWLCRMPGLMHYVHLFFANI